MATTTRRTCPKCNGTGEYDVFRACSRCAGRGFINPQREADRRASFSVADAYQDEMMAAYYAGEMDWYSEMKAADDAANALF